MSADRDQLDRNKCFKMKLILFGSHAASTSYLSPIITHCLLQTTSIAANTKAEGDSDASPRSQTRMNDATGQNNSPQQVCSHLSLKI